jgi:hypothetical protein
MKETQRFNPPSWKVIASQGRHLLLALMIAVVTAALFMKVPRALAGNLAQTSTGLNEAVESVEAQEGIDELEGQNNDSQLSEGQEGVDELEGQNNDSQLSESQQGIDQPDGANGSSQADEGQQGSGQADGQN